MVVKSRTFSGLSGSYAYVTPTAEYPRERSYAFSGSETVYTSVSNPKGNNDFMVNRTQISGSICEGKYGNYDEWFDSYSSYPTNMYSYTGEGVTQMIPDDAAMRLFAACNPYRATILGPAFLAELRELPKLIYDLGRLKLNKKPIYKDAREISQAWVGANFGWAPLVNDLMALVNFADLNAKREKEFDAMYSSKGLTKHLSLGSQTGAPINIYIDGPAPPFPMPNIIATGTPITRVWGMVRYLPARTPSGSPVARPTPQGVRNAMAGLTFDGAIQSAWELLPWSWFIDYTYNLGGVLAANAGKRFLEYERACIMAHTTVDIVHPAYSYTDKFNKTLSVSAGSNRRETKTRSVLTGPPSLPTPHLPALSAGQLSVLGGLIHIKSRGLRNT